MSGRGIRPLFAAIAAALALLVLAACVNIPTNGSVSTQQIDPGGLDNEPIPQPAGPVTGMTPEQIIQGFIRAGSGPQLGYSVARQFLTDDFSHKWDPTAAVLVSSSIIAPVALAANTYSVSVAVSARVDGSGQYTTVPGSQDLAFGLVQDSKKQWRISQAPDGTVLSPLSFSSVFDAYRVYFFDPTFNYLVPDLRWFLKSNIANRVVHALIAGPSAWLGSGTLVSAFPAGTELTKTPQIDSGQATVDLTAQVSGAPPVDQRRMLQQLNQSLREALSTVRDVGITVGGFPLQIQGDVDLPDSSYQVGADPVGGFNGAFGLVGAKGVQQLGAIGTKANALVPDAATLATDRRSVAVRGPGGVSLVRAGAATVPIDTRSGLVSPSMDPEGYTWTVPAAQPGGLKATAPNGTSFAIGSLPSDSRVVSFDVSRDGARVLVALSTPTGPRLIVAGVQRNADFAPIALGDPITLPTGTAPLVDATWVDGVQVAVLSGSGTESVDLYEIGGQRIELGTLAGGRTIVGGNGVDGIRVLNSDGVVLQPTGAAGWQDSGLRASFLATQL